MSKDQLWTVRNFSRLVRKYGGKYIGVYQQRVLGVAKTPKDLIKKIHFTHPEKVYFFKVPREEELVYLL